MVVIKTSLLTTVPRISASGVPDSTQEKHESGATLRAAAKRNSCMILQQSGSSSKKLNSFAFSTTTNSCYLI
jgi:hypothetical protein